MHEWVSVEEASRRLGVSPSTIRRMIEAGKLVGEREVIGGAKERYKVRMETQQPIHYDAPNPGLPSESSDAPDTRHDAPAITEQALAILDTVLRANAEMMDWQAKRIDRLNEIMRQEAERRIRAEADRDHLAQQLAAERAAREAAERKLEARRWWEVWK